MDYEQAHPQEPRLEQFVIARIVRNQVEREIARELLLRRDFSCKIRAQLFASLSTLADCDEELAKSVCDRLSEPSVGLEDSLASLARRELESCLELQRTFDEAAPIRAYAKRLREAAVLRNYAELSARMVMQASAGAIQDYEDAVRKFATYVSRQEERLIGEASAGPESMAELMSEARLRLHETEEDRAKRVAGGSRMDTVRKAMGTLRRGDVYGLVANPAAGKTAFALQLAMDLSIERRVVFFELEMPKDQCATRILSNMTGIPAEVFDAGSYTEDHKRRIENVALALSQCDITWKDCPSMWVEDLVAAVRTEHARKPIDVLMIDYLQKLLTKKPFKSRTEALSYISNVVKSLVMELNIACVFVASINRDAAKEARPPTMHDIRDCGQIEYDVHTMIALHNPASAQKPKVRAVVGVGYVEEPVAPRHSDREDIEMHVLKRRDGKPGVVVPLQFFPACFQFRESTLRLVK